MIARWLPAKGTPTTMIDLVREIAREHPGDDALEIVVPEGKLRLGESVRVDRDLMRALDDLGGHTELLP